MKKVAFANLLRSRPRPQQCRLEIVELDAASPDETGARFLVTLRQGTLRGELLAEARESTLTVRPCSLAEAERRALDFIQRRLAAGDELQQHGGLSALSASPDTPPSLGSSQPARPVPTFRDEVVPPYIMALLASLRPDRWKLLSPGRQARRVWRLGEYSDAASTEPKQRALVMAVPRLVELIESGDDLLDHCLAVAMARLGDPGAAPAMQALSERGRSPATRRVAHQAWLVLQSPEGRRAHADQVLARWPAAADALDGLASLAPAGERLAALAQRLANGGPAWDALLTDWYDAALALPGPRASLLALLRVLPLRPGVFQAVRHLYKAAELRLDAAVLGALHARFENTPAFVHNRAPMVRHGFMLPGTSTWVKTSMVQELRRPDARLAYTGRTRDYLRLRGWRTLRRLAELGHSQAPVLATELLLGLTDEDLPPAREEARWADVDGRYQRTVRHYHPGAGWLLVSRLLLARHPGVKVSARATRWWTDQPLDDTQAMPGRFEALPTMWDAHPEALLTLALRSRCALVHAVVARALQDHTEFVGRQPAGVLKALLQSAWSPTAGLGFEVVRARLTGLVSLADQVPWLVLLMHSRDPRAREFALVHIASDPVGFAREVALVSALLLSSDERMRRQGHGLAPLAHAEALVAELQRALQAAGDDVTPVALDALETLLQGALAAEAASAPVEPLLCLLNHPQASVVQLAVSWLLRHDHGAALVPPSALARLLGEADPRRRAAGVRLFAALPDTVLRTQTGLLCDLALHPHHGIRSAVEPALQRLAADDPVFARALAERLHAALFTAEPDDPVPTDGLPDGPEEGLHDQALRWLTTDLQAVAPARDPDSVWRALQARSRGAQRYGAWALNALAPASLSLRQQAVLVCHVDVNVRAWAMRAVEQTLWGDAVQTQIPSPPPSLVEQLLPVADTDFDDARAWAQHLLGERVPEVSLTPELRVAWVDHPRPWMQALGRARLVRQMSASEASLCLTRLSQHPGAQVQQFVTQWLLELPRDNPVQLAVQLQTLRPYFVTVLSQVHRGRVAKSRIIDFLRSTCEAAAPAAVVAEIFARQVVTASLTDKPQYIAGLRDIAARHPHIELPFLTWVPPPQRAPSAGAVSS